MVYVIESNIQEKGQNSFFCIIRCSVHVLSRVESEKMVFRAVPEQKLYSKAAPAFTQKKG